MLLDIYYSTSESWRVHHPTPLRRPSRVGRQFGICVKFQNSVPMWDMHIRYSHKLSTMTRRPDLRLYYNKYIFHCYSKQGKHRKHHKVLSKGKGLKKSQFNQLIKLVQVWTVELEFSKKIPIAQFDNGKTNQHRQGGLRRIIGGSPFHFNKCRSLRRIFIKFI